MKKLKLRIAKFDKLLIVQQLEKAGEFKRTNHVKVDGDLYLFAASIDLQERTDDKSANCREFIDNTERDEYAANLIKWITKEQFGGDRKLEVGKECLVSDDRKEWSKTHLLAILPKNKNYRYIVCSNLENEEWTSCEYAKPISDCLKIDGEIYTWEMEE
jgi:hypothetical protein